MDPIARGGRLLLSLAFVAAGLCCGPRTNAPVGVWTERPATSAYGAGGDGPQPGPAAVARADVRAGMTRIVERFRSEGHGERFDAVLWANEAARDAWSREAVAPDGAALAEELVERDDRGTESAAGLLVMRKSGGGWRFSAVSRDGTAAPDARVARCADCHRDAPRDGVFGLGAASLTRLVR